MVYFGKARLLPEMGLNLVFSAYFSRRSYYYSPFFDDGCTITKHEYTSTSTRCLLHGSLLASLPHHRRYQEQMDRASAALSEGFDPTEPRSYAALST